MSQEDIKIFILLYKYLLKNKMNGVKLLIDLKKTNFLGIF